MTIVRVQDLASTNWLSYKIFGAKISRRLSSQTPVESENLGQAGGTALQTQRCFG